MTDSQSVRLLYVTKTKEPEVVPKPILVDGADYGRVFAFAGQMLKAVEAGLAWPTPSHLCPCAYQDYCRAWR